MKSALLFMAYITAGSPTYLNTHTCTIHVSKIPLLPSSRLRIQKSIVLGCRVAHRFMATEKTWENISAQHKYLLPVPWLVTVVWAKGITIYFPHIIHNGYLSQVIKGEQWHCPPVEIGIEAWFWSSSCVIKKKKTKPPQFNQIYILEWQQ